MKRSLVFCAIALVAMVANSADAAVRAQLNLRYDDPADTSLGGSWDLLILSDNGNGVAGVTVLLQDVDPNPTQAGSDVSPNDGNFDHGFNIYGTQTVGTVTEIITGTNLVTPNTSVGLGVVGSNGGVADDLFPGSSPTWNGSALIAQGTFGATRPSFVASAPNPTPTNPNATLDIGANEFVAAATAATLTSLDLANSSVRGDSVVPDGLRPGDTNRDGFVDVTDLGALATNWELSPRGWDQGNFNSTVDDIVDVTDLGALATNWELPTTPPSIGAVPEPASAFLGLVGAALLFTRRR